MVLFTTCKLHAPEHNAHICKCNHGHQLSAVGKVRCNLIRPHHSENNLTLFLFLDFVCGENNSVILQVIFFVKPSHMSSILKLKGNFCGHEKEGHFHYKNFLRALGPNHGDKIPLLWLRLIQDNPNSHVGTHFKALKTFL